MDDLVQNILDKAPVQKLATHGEGDFQGKVYCLFKIRDGSGYFVLMSKYGSYGECDSWADGNGTEFTVRRLLRGAQIYRELKDVPVGRYDPSEWSDAVRALL